MAFFVLHNILFPCTRLANQHLLLDEFEWISLRRNRISPAQLVGNKTQQQDREQLIQDSIQEEEGELQVEFINTHTILFIMSLMNFALSHKTLNKIHLKQDLRKYLCNILLTLLVSLSGYLYTANTIDSLTRSVRPNAGSLLRFIHGAILIMFLAISQWSQFIVNSICDTLSVRASIQETPKAEKGSISFFNKFVTQLMMGSFSAALTSLSLAQIFISSDIFVTSKIGYTNIILLMAILTTVLELICFKLLTVDQIRPTNSRQKTVTTISLKDNDEKRLNSKLNRKDTFHDNKSPFTLSDNRRSLPSFVWSISAKNTRKKSETTHSTDDDEFDNSTLQCHQNCLDFRLTSDARFRAANQQQQIVSIDLGGDVELFDRTKYSLYDENDFKIEDERVRSSKKSNNNRIDIISDLAFEQQRQQKQDNLMSQHERFSSVLEILLLGDWPFVWQTTALILIGTVYQANQLCFFSEYISYLLYKSPRQFRWALLVGAGYLVKPHPTNTGASFDTIWICLMCLSILAQNTARLFGLHYANSIMIRLGTAKLLWLLLVISLTVPFQFVCNYYLVETSYDPIYLETRTIAIFAHIIFIQLTIGLLGALLDMTVNELALQYAQHVKTYRTCKISPDRSDGSIQCTIHGLLNGSFVFVGTATMSAIRILVENANIDSQLEKGDATFSAIVFIAFAPIVIILLLSISVGFHKWTLGRSQTKVN